MSMPSGNVRLKAARQHAGFSSQQALADALNRAARQLGIKNLSLSARQVRRWESADPPWPRSDHQKLLAHVLHLPVEQLGFTPPWHAGADDQPGTAAPPRRTSPPSLAARGGMVQPAAAVSDYAAITAAHRRLYWTVQPAHLHPPVTEHASMGTRLMAQASGAGRQILAAALAESLLLAGRIEFFDLGQAASAEQTFGRAMQAAGESGDDLLGSAVLAHSAFIPGWIRERKQAADRMRAARAFARRGPASPLFIAWLDAVEAECETISGHTSEALSLISSAEALLAGDDGSDRSPDWFNWFSPVRLAAFKGRTQLIGGHLAQAQETLSSALGNSGPDDDKQQAVILGDLAAVHAARKDPQAACQLAMQALDQLSRTWYATGMDRILAVREKLEPWAGEECVQALDDQLYNWQTTLSALQR